MPAEAPSSDRPLPGDAAGAAVDADTPAEAAAGHDAPFHRLAPLPRPLWLPALINSVGHCGRRLADLQRWRAALLRGELPPADADFGDADAVAPLRATCGDLGLPALCAGTEAVAEQLLRTLLWHLDRLIDLQPALSRVRAIAQVDAEFRAVWVVDKADIERVQHLLQGLGILSNLSWDALRGQLNRREWGDARRLGDTLAQLPELVALIRRLGRSERAAMPQALPPLPQPDGARRQTGLKLVETRLPDAPGELHGIRHADRIAQMLGSEAAMLLHPVLHKLWRARRAEARLLCYDSQAVLHDLRPDPAAPPRHDLAPPRPEPLERGPIIVCLDTSGSMRGGPETLAKAVALQALRTAQAERRGCLLVAFGGPDELIARDLADPAGGLAALLDLIGLSFDGGTDIQGAIECVIDHVHQQRWASADLLIVSDGEFGCTPAMLARLDEARAVLGLRVQGVLVGDRETMGLMEVADNIFWIRDWRRHGDAATAARGFSPVHSKSLTALYFPNALSGRAARHRPG